MSPAPLEIGNARVICFAILDDETAATGKCTHRLHGEDLMQDDFGGLAVCLYESSEGYYLFYCDSMWKAVTDTYHETLEHAKRQADFEFEGLATKWSSPECSS